MSCRSGWQCRHGSCGAADLVAGVLLSGCAPLDDVGKDIGGSSVSWLLWIDRLLVD